MRTRLPLLVAFALIATACQIRFDTSVIVNENGSGIFAIEISLDEEFRQLSEENDGEFSFAEGFEEDPPEGWIVEPFVDGEFEGVRITTDFTSLDDLNARLAQLSALAAEDESPADLFGEMVIEQDGNTFSFRAGADGLSESLFSDGGSEGFEGFDPTALFESLFVIRLLVTLPGEAGDHNADEVSDGTFIWNIGLEDEGSEFFASSTVAGGGFNPLVIVLVVVAIAAAVFWILSRREDGSSTIVDYVPPTDD